MSDTHVSRERSLLLGPMAADTRRSLGPLAWAALEALVADARSTHGVDVVESTVRELAARLGVAKNTAHRALAALGDAGFVESLQSRSSSGQFSSGSYRLAVPASVLSVSEASASASPAAPLSPARPSRSSRSPASQQLSLLSPS